MSVNTLHLLFPRSEKPLVRFELTTHALRMRCSTPELQRQMLCAAAAYHTLPGIASLFLEKNHLSAAEFSRTYILGLNLQPFGYKICPL